MLTLIDEVRLSRSLPPPAHCRRIRRCAGISQIRLARELKVHPQTIGRWERGQRVPRGKLRLAYARELAALEALEPPS